MAHPLPTDAVTADVAFHCEDQLGRPLAFMSTCRYDPADPFAVEVVFHVPGGDVPWLMARSLLRAGLARPAGEGDVRLEPGLDEDGRPVVELEFRTPEGRLRSHVRASELTAFLAATDAVVPPGTESALAAVDVLLAELLGPSRPI